MLFRFFALLAMLGVLAVPPLAAQTAPERGTFLVYAEESGLAFVSREPSLVESGVWPLEFYYFEEGDIAGTARMTGRADCALGLVRGRLTHINGASLPENTVAQTPEFTFARAAETGGDPAIVNFICGGGADAVPIARSPAETVAVYNRLTALGLSLDIAARLAPSDAESAVALIATLVPEAQRAAVRAALGEEAQGPSPE